METNVHAEPQTNAPATRQRRQVEDVFVAPRVASGSRVLLLCRFYLYDGPRFHSRTWSQKSTSIKVGGKLHNKRVVVGVDTNYELLFSAFLLFSHDARPVIASLFVILCLHAD